jgi:hypothetical protein
VSEARSAICNCRKRSGSRNRDVYKNIPPTLLLLALAAGCSSDPAPRPGAPGNTADASRSASDATASAADASAAPDAGGGDASAIADASPAADAASGADASPAADAASTPDSGVAGGPVCESLCSTGGAPGPVTAPLGLATLVADVARAQCAALFRCCNAVDMTTYFAPIRRDGEAMWELASFRPRLPPDAANFTQSDCDAVMTEILEITPFGPWVRAAQANRVTFVPAEYATCMASLETAACGAPLQAALFDSTCLAFGAPAGGAERRKVFDRTSAQGACDAIPDGTGARVYGTCDPDQAFCCFRPAADPNAPCWFNGSGRVGTCAAVSQVGQPCGLDVQRRSAQFCATGLVCDANAGMCIREPTTPLQLGARCFMGGNSLGECPADSYCDLFGTELCTAERTAGQSCMSSEECSTGLCR